MQGRPIWLVGMMGAGKSTVGAALARRLARSFIDLDREIERRDGRSVSEIFAQEGEAFFRERERRAMERAEREAAVVALGGGAIAQSGMADRLARTGTVVYLRATPEQLLARLGKCEGRPLLAGLEAKQRRARIESLMAMRERHYRSAAISVDAGISGVEAVAGEIERCLRGREEAAGGGRHSALDGKSR